MTLAEAASVVLTKEQRRVVASPVDALLLVSAGPGAGKTTTLVHRIGQLVVQEDVEPSELLVLTFSRAAVAMLRRRLRELGDAVARVRARTFDSWALEVLLESGRAEGAFGGDFEGRIERATAALADGDCDGLLEDLSHVIVDETQDLVGVRRRLVATLLENFECGFTLVGDLAQSIYGFQSEKPGQETGAFVGDLRAAFRTDLVELELTANFRARTEEARRALPFGDPLRSVALGGRRNLLRDLRDELESLNPLGGLDEAFTLDALREYEGYTGILCRTNGEALLVSEALFEGLVPHRLRREATDRAAPAWLGRLFREHHGAALTRDSFETLAVGLDLGRSVEDAWRLLLRTARDRGGRLVDMERLRAAIAQGRLPDELVAEDEASLLVSSFHRAKGLEFDRVVAVDPGEAGAEDTDEDEEARLLYVAMTRARDELWRLEPVRTWTVRLAKRADRWGRFGRERWQRWGVEVGRGDVAAEQPRHDGDHAAAEARQDRAVDRVREGDRVEFRRLDIVVPDGQAPEYLVVHEDEPVGTASPRFREGLRRFMQQGPHDRPRTYPSVLREARVDSVETVVGGAAAASEADLNEFGVRRVPRLVGLSRFVYRKDETDD